MSTNANRRRVPVSALLARSATSAVTRYVAHAGPHLAGSIAFRVLFSIFPLVIVLTAVFGIVLRVTGLRADAVDAIVSNVPLSEEGGEDLRRLLEGATGARSELGLVALIGLVWAAGGMMSAIRDALNRAWSVEARRPFLRGKALDVALVFGATLLVLLSLTIAVGARLVERYAGEALGAGGFPTGFLSWIAGLAAPFVLAFATVLFLYRVVPATRPRLADVWPAVTLVALVFALLQNLFAVYLAHFSNYDTVYGSLGAVIAFLFYVYLAANVFLLGAEVAAQWPAVREELERERTPAATGARAGDAG